jgi:hypothetical protein
MNPEGGVSSLGFDVDKSRAVLVGTSRYFKDPDNLPNLPAVVANIIDFERLIRDPGTMGLGADRVERILDEEDIAHVAERVAELSSSAEDLFLFYYSGHGLISESGDLLLTFTKSSHAYAEANCLHWATLKKYLLSSNATTKLVILDCCFSGRASELMGVEGEVLKRDLDVHGTIVLASSPKNEPSLASSADMRRTAFTDALLVAIEQGVDNSSMTVSIDEVFNTTRQKLRSVAAPEPQMVGSAGAHGVSLVLNRRSEISKENASFEEVVKQVEARVSLFLDNRLGLESKILTEEYDEEVERKAGRSNRSMFNLALLLAACCWFPIGEVAWLAHLGMPPHYSSSSSPISLGGFILTVAVLLVVSGMVVALAVVTLRSPQRRVLLGTFFPSRWSARLVARLGMGNVVIVTFTALIVPFLKI